MKRRTSKTKTTYIRPATDPKCKVGDLCFVTYNGPLAVRVVDVHRKGRTTYYVVNPTAGHARPFPVTRIGKVIHEFEV